MQVCYLFYKSINDEDMCFATYSSDPQVALNKFMRILEGRYNLDEAWEHISDEDWDNWEVTYLLEEPNSIKGYTPNMTWKDEAGNFDYGFWTSIKEKEDTRSVTLN